jgi:hypothetical protein
LGKQIVKVNDLISGIQVWLNSQIIITTSLTVALSRSVAPFDIRKSTGGVLLPK